MHTNRGTKWADTSLLLVAMIWGTGFVAVEYAFRAGLGTAALMSLRFAIATVVMLPFCWKQVRAAGRRTIVHGIIAGVILCAAFYAQTYGQAHTSISNSAFLTATNVMMVPFIVWIITKKRPPAKVYALACCTMLGVSVLAVRFGEEGVRVAYGDVFVLISALLFSLHIAYLGTYTRQLNARVIAFVQIATACAIATVVFVGWDLGSLQQVSWGQGLLPVAYLGCFSTCLCFFLQTKAQQHTSAAKASILLCTESLFGSLFSVILGMDVLTVNLLAGGAIILACVLLTEVDFSHFYPARGRRKSA